MCRIQDWCEYTLYATDSFVLFCKIVKDSGWFTQHSRYHHATRGPSLLRIFSRISLADARRRVTFDLLLWLLLEYAPSFGILAPSSVSADEGSGHFYFGLIVRAFVKGRVGFGWGDGGCEWDEIRWLRRRWMIGVDEVMSLMDEAMMAVDDTMLESDEAIGR